MNQIAPTTGYSKHRRISCRISQRETQSRPGDEVSTPGLNPSRRSSPSGRWPYVTHARLRLWRPWIPQVRLNRTSQLHHQRFHATFISQSSNNGEDAIQTYQSQSCTPRSDISWNTD